MPNLMNRGASWLATRLQTAGGRSVSYQRGNDDPVSLTGTPTKHVYEVVNSEGGLTQVEIWDWILTLTDLGFEPWQGDLITESLNSAARTYRVSKIGDQPCFTWLDTSGVMLLVHSTLDRSE